MKNLHVRLSASVTEYRQQLGAAGAATRDFGREVNAAARRGGEGMETMGRTAALMGAAMAAGFVLAGKAAVDFESAMAGVAKTFPGTAGQLAEVETGIRRMARELPATTSEIAAVAEAAGQLGIEAGSVLGFSRTMIDLGETTNLSADQAATALARLANITQMPQTEFDRLGSTVVELGNNLATTEAEIVEMGLRIAGAGDQIGLTEAEILGFAGALSSVGIEAQAGGTSISKVMIDIANEVETTGSRLETFAAVAGMSGDEFAAAFRDDAGLAVVEFVEGLGDMESQGGSTLQVLADLGIEEVRMRDALLRASGAGDLLRESLELGSDAWDENTALMTEAETRYQTTASQIEIARNKVTDLAIDTGTLLLPALNSGVGLLGNFADGLASLPGPAKTAATGVSGVLTVVTGLGGGFLLVAPKIDRAKRALADMGNTGQMVSRNLGRITGALAGVGIAVGAGVLLYERATRASREYAENVRELRGLLEPVTEGQANLNEQLQEFLEIRIREGPDEAVEALNNLKVSMGDVEAAIRSGGDALDPLRDRLAELGVDLDGIDLGKIDDGGHVAVEALNRFADAAGISAGASADLVDWLEDLDNEAQDAAKAELELAVSQGDLTDAQLRGALTMSSLFSETDNYVGALGLLYPEQEATTEATEGTTEALMAEAEQAAATEEELERLEERHQAVGEAFGEFTDALTAWDDVIAANREWAESVASSTEDAEDSWEDYYDGFSVATDDWIKEMQRQVEAQQEWRNNLVEITQAGRHDVAEILAAMGPEGAELAQRFTDLTGEEFQTAADLFVQTMGDGASSAGAILDQELAVMAAIGEAGAKATADGVAEQLGIGVGEVHRIAAQYGVALATGINPVLRGIGKVTVSVSGVAAGALSVLGRAHGGPVPGVGNGDTVPAMLTPGEYVIRKEAVRALGLDRLHELNQADRIRGFNAGGFVTPDDVPPPPDVSAHGDMVGHAGGATMEHLYEEVRRWVKDNAMVASGSSTGLDPAFLGMFNRYNAALGGILRIISGFRSSAQQQVLYQRYLAGTGNLAAPPGRSKHERGLAIDHAPRASGPMKSTARGFGLHYPVRGEPWHVEPIHVRDQGGPLLPGLTWNGTGRAEMVVPHRFADGGLVPGMFPGGSGGEAPGGWERTQAMFSVGAMDPETYRQHLRRRLTQFQQFSTEWVAAYQELVRFEDDAEAERARLQQEAAEREEADYRRRREANDNMFRLGQLSTEDHLFNLERRMEREIEFSNEWTRLYEEREQVLADAVAREREIFDNRYELGLVSTDEYLAELDRRLEGEEAYTDQWMAILRERRRVYDEAADALTQLVDDRRAINKKLEDEQRRHAARMVELEQKLSESLEQAQKRRLAAMDEARAKFSRSRSEAIAQRVSDLEGWADAEERATVRWGNTVGAITRNMADQARQFAEWQQLLADARERGVSGAVVEMLGLDQGPEALGQLRVFAAATDEELAALNEAAGDRQAQAAGQAQSEAVDSASKLSQVLVEMQRDLNAELDAINAEYREREGELREQFAEDVEALNADLLEKQEEYAEKLAELGRDQGRDYADAVAEGLLSGIPAIEAAARKLRDAMAGGDSGDPASSSGSRPGEGWFWSMPQYATGTAYVGRTGPAIVHRGERILSTTENQDLIRVIDNAAGGQTAPVVNVRADVYVDGEKMIDDRVRVVIRDDNTDAVIAGSR